MRFSAWHISMTVPFVIALIMIPFLVSAGTHPVWYRMLSFGLRGQDIIELQNILIAQGDLATGNNTGYFGRLTEAAVKKFQCRMNIVCSGTPSSTGYGAVGPRTRAKILEGFDSGGTVSANFSASPTSGAAPLTVQFSVPGIDSSYSVFFGDGQNAPLQESPELIQPAIWRVSHTYSSPGSYTATLTKTDPYFCGTPGPSGVVHCSNITSHAVGTVTITVTNSTSLSEQIEQVYSEIKGSINIVATDVSQCRTMAMGHKACGGPGSYLIYSASTTDESKLTSLVAKIGDLEAQYEREQAAKGNIMMSTCDLTMPPKVELKNGMCVAASSGIQVQ